MAKVVGRRNLKPSANPTRGKSLSDFRLSEVKFGKKQLLASDPIVLELIRKSVKMPGK